jgi:hypothetical protein
MSNYKAWRDGHKKVRRVHRVRRRAGMWAAFRKALSHKRITMMRQEMFLGTQERVE